jgi:hypothetical protein
MNSCKLGIHKWALTNEGENRWCTQCQKKQELDDEGRWIESLPTKKLVDDSKFCKCPQDYTISIKSMACPRCALPRRPRVIPSNNGDAWKPR